MENYQRYQNGCRPFLQGEEYPVAMAYVPWQYWNAVYDLEKGLAYGTIFPELNKPFLGVRGGLRGWHREPRPDSRCLNGWIC